MSTKPAIIDKQAAGRLIVVRKHLKMSQTEMSEATGIPQSSISKMEKGIISIPPHLLKVLFFKFNISPTYIVVGGDEKMQYRKEDKTLITDTRDLRSEIEILSARLTKTEQDLRILSQKLQS